MIKDRNIAIDAAIQDTKIYGLTAKGDTYYVLKSSAALYEYTVARVTGGTLFTTVDAAVNACTANHGDVIKILPGHTESIATASGVTCDVAGVTIIGYGEGADKPTFTFSSADNSATWVISAASNVLKNIIATTSDDGLTNAFVVTGDNCELDIEWRDTSAAVETATAVRLDTANNSKLNLVYKGFTAGNAVTSAVLLDDCDNVDITIDAYGLVSTAWVNMVDVGSTNVKVAGTLYTQGISNYTRDVVDTIGTSTWSAEIFDASFGGKVSGGSAAALAADDVSAVATSVAAIQTDLGNPSARTNLQTIEAMLGNPDTAGATIFAAIGGAAGLPSYPAGAAAANDVSVAEAVRYAQEAVRQDGGTPMAASKGVADALGTDGTTVTDSAVSVLGAIGANNADNAFDSSAVVANIDGSALERLEDLVVKVTAVDDILDSEFPVVATAVGAVADAALADTIEGAAAATQSVLTDVKGILQRIGADNADNTAATTLVVANADGSLLERAEYIQTDMLALPRCVEKSDGAILTGNDNLFTISGGPIKILSIVGIVTVEIGGASNGDIQLVTTAPAATVNLNAAPVAIDSDAVGTSYTTVNTTGIFTPTTAGFVLYANSFATNDTEFLAPAGTIHFRSSAAQTGNIKWYLRYIPLSPLSRVVAAA